MTRSITVFCVYADTDEALWRQNVIAGWQPILAGALWAEKTEQAFEEGELMELVASRDFLDSERGDAQRMRSVFPVNAFRDQRRLFPFREEEVVRW